MKDDLQSWIYLVAFITKRRLPWEVTNVLNPAKMKLHRSPDIYCVLDYSQFQINLSENN